MKDLAQRIEDVLEDYYGLRSEAKYTDVAQAILKLFNKELEGLAKDIASLQIRREFIANNEWGPALIERNEVLTRIRSLSASSLK